MKDLVEIEVRELLESYGFPQDLPVVKVLHVRLWKRGNLLS